MTRTREEATEAVKALVTASKRGCVSTHSLQWEGTPEEKELLLSMVGTSADDIFDPRRVYIYWNCLSDYPCNGILYLFRRWPHNLNEEALEDVCCDECGYQVDEDDLEDLTLNALMVELHVRPDAPFYPVDPEGQRQEGRESNSSESPYVRNSVPDQMWLEGYVEACQFSRAVAKRQELLDAHPKLAAENRHLRDLLAAACQRLEAIEGNDLTQYEHHQPRRDGQLPSVDGGTCWKTPREIARSLRKQLEGEL